MVAQDGVDAGDDVTGQFRLVLLVQVLEYPPLVLVDESLIVCICGCRSSVICQELLLLLMLLQL